MTDLEGRRAASASLMAHEVLVRTSIPYTDQHDADESVHCCNCNIKHLGTLKEREHYRSSMSTCAGIKIGCAEFNLNHADGQIVHLVIVNFKLKESRSVCRCSNYFKYNICSL